jgi:hypothetical protein
MSVAFRLWIDGEWKVDEIHDIPEDEGEDKLIEEQLERRASLFLNADRYLVELEFLDLPSEERFFRFGNAPEQMTTPIAIKSDDQLKGIVSKWPFTEEANQS